MEPSEAAPEWAKQRACDLMNEARPKGQPAYSVCGLDFDGRWTGIAVAFARYIAEHEEPPVDPLLIEARKLAADYHNIGTEAQEMREGARDHWQVNLALRALRRGMELAEARND